MTKNDKIDGNVISLDRWSIVNKECIWKDKVYNLNNDCAVS